MVTVADLIEYRRRTEKLVERVVSVRLPTEFGEFQARRVPRAPHRQAARRARQGGHRGRGERPRPRALRVPDGRRLPLAPVRLRRAARAGARAHRGRGPRGVVLYMGQEGRGIGLLNKLRAYELQANGLDTVEANLALGFPPDAREWGIGNQILADLGLTTIRILTNNPRKLTGLDGYGLTVVEQVPLEVEPTAENARYLAAKREKLGHTITKLHHQGARLEGDAAGGLRMSSRDIDSTSENVLHDWARDEAREAEPEDERSEDEPTSATSRRRLAAARGTAASPTPRPRPRETSSEPRRAEPEATSRTRRRSTSRPEDRRSTRRRCTSSSRTSTRPATCTSRRLRRARGRRRGWAPCRRRRRLALQRQRHDAAPRRRARRARRRRRAPGGDHDHGRPRRLRAAAGRDRARQDPPLRVHRRARLRHPRRHAALRLRLERGGERPPARGARDRRPGLVRRPHARSRRAGRGADRQGRRGRAQRARDGRPLRASSGRAAPPRGAKDSPPTGALARASRRSPRSRS